MTSDCALDFEYIRSGSDMMCPKSAAETNQEGLAYGSGLNDMGFRIYQKYLYEHVSALKKKAQQENTSHWRIIYQSDGNLETVDHAKGHDQPKSFVITNFQIRSKYWSLVFNQVYNIYEFSSF